MGIIINNLTFGFTDKLIEGLSCSFDSGWTAVTGANGAGKTTLLRLITGELKPEIGTISLSGPYVFCRQMMEDLPDEARIMFEDGSSEAYKLRYRFGLQSEWFYNWRDLSLGEQKRIQIASAFYLTPDILILDEPSNHLDFKSRELLLNELKRFDGTGVIVSHDRSFLNDLASRTLFLDPPNHELRNQNYSDASEARKTEQNWREQQRRNKTRQIRRLEKRAAEYRNLAKSADRRNSKRNIKPADHDAKFKLDAARLQGKDAMHGRMMNRLQGRINQEKDKIDQYKTAKSGKFDFSLHFTPSKNRNLFTVSEGALKMGEKDLHFGNFEMQSEDKIALIGPNGSGKSTLLDHIYSRCRTESTLYLKQEIKSADAFFKRLNELNSSEKGRIFSIMAALGSPPERALLAEKPSPGEMRKLIIAEAITRKVEFLILDEPTNHLDLPSIEALEAALKEYRAGLLLVSHDRSFLKNTTDTAWEIETPDDTECRLVK